MLRYIPIITIAFIFACNSQLKTDLTKQKDKNDGTPPEGVPWVSLPGGVGNSKKMQKEFRPGQKNGLTFDEASVNLDGDEIDQTTMIGIESLTTTELPALDPGMTNVTKGARKGYRFTPTPQQFIQNVQVTIPYDTSLIPQGLSENDVKTYYYDTGLQHWQALDRSSIDTTQKNITSDSNHFTDMINATVTVPDHPEAVSFNPTQIKDIKAADPGTGINLMEPPKANNNGDARMSYPIELPPGRSGLAPQLQVAYNSGGGVGGNGWMGLGWDLSVPVVSVDTRWGVPRYSAGEETETYTLNGEQLTPVTHRSVYVPRSADKIFHTRVEGQFRRIIRRGTHPNNYTWEVTEKNGTKNIYGACDPGTETLSDGGGNRFLWALCETRDTNGNFVRYTHSLVSHSGISGGSPGTNIYPQTINYTGNGGAAGAYTVTFFRDQSRADVSIDARGGFKRVTADLLKRIDITFNSQLVRRYNFGYNENPYGDNRSGTAFNKTLLTSINQHMADGTLFNKHTFNYYDEARYADGSYKGFAPTAGWSIGSDGVSAGLLGEGAASAIGGTKGTSKGGNFYVGFGIGLNILSKDFSAGVKATYSVSDSETLITLTDVNGDGLPDKVFRSGGGFVYRPNLSTPFAAGNFGSAIGLPSLSSIGRERSTSTSFGADVYFAIVPLATDSNSTTTISEAYLADVNGDGIIDIVDGGQVRFGFLAAGSIPTFSANSSDTPVPYGGGAIDTGNLFANAAQVEAERAQKFPLVDTLRRWIAPYSGVVRIDGTVRLIQDTSPARAQYTNADGVRVAIQLQGAELAARIIAADNYSAQTFSGVSAVSVTRGDPIYFRVGSRFDGAYDQVEWDPEITYTSLSSGGLNASLKDVNDLDEYRYKASSDFTLAGRGGSVTLPVSGDLHLAGVFVKSAATTDTVTLLITKNGSEVYRRTFSDSEIATVLLNQDLMNVVQSDTMEWKIQIDSPIDATKISFKPLGWYTRADGINPSNIRDENGNYNLQLKIPYAMDLYPASNLTTAQTGYTVPAPIPASAAATRTATVSANLEFTGLDNGEIKTGVLTVKRRGALLAKQEIVATGTGSSTPLIVPIFTSATVTTGDEVYFDISSRDASFGAKLTAATVRINAGALVTVPHALHTPASDGLFTQPYRGWGYAAYQGNSPRDIQPIDQLLLIIDQNTTAENVKAYSAAPDLTTNRWLSVDDAVWVSANSISSSRMGPKDIRVPTGAQFAGAGAPPRISESSGNANTVTVYSESNGTSRSLMDFQDLNGDRYPDVIGQGGVQYTMSNGAFEPGQRGGVLSGSRQSKSHVESFSISSGGAARAASNARAMLAPNGQSSASTAQQGSQQPAFGLGGDLGSASSNTEFELMDINGDGLPDKVYENGTAQLNFGYSFGPVENWGAGVISNGQTQNQALNMSYSVAAGSFSGGLNLATSTTSSAETYVDINGDGLPDKILAGSPMRVRLNTGAGFTGGITWPRGHGNVAIDKNISLGGGGSATGGIPIPIPFAPLKIIFSGGANYSTSMGRPELTFRDMDGDGFADHIFSQSDGDLRVAANPIGRTNILNKITRPMGATIALEYSRDGSTYELPQSRWNLTRVTVFDGHVGEGVDTQITTFEYQAPHHDRLEREFFGYGTVVERHLDTQNSNVPYRSLTRTYFTNNYYAKGLMGRERMADAAGRLFTETENTYVLHNVDTNSPLSGPSTTATVFPQLIRTEKRFFEGTSSAEKTTYTTHEYDSLGNITRFMDAGDNGSSDDVDATITYSNCQPNYIIEPTMITVYGGGSLMRKRESTLDCNTGDVTQVKQYVDGSNAAVTDLTYEANGNLKEVIGPENKTAQRYKLTYAYDTATQSQVTQITDSFGLTSTVSYDLRFVKPTTTTDTNGQQTTYTYDSAGRSVSLVGPYEQALGQTTISFEYHPTAAVPYALTKHIDKDAAGNLKSSGTIDTVLFIDGLKRVLQTKKDATVKDTNGQPKDVMVVTGQVKFDAFGRTIEQYYPVTENKGGLNYAYNTAFDSVSPTRTVYDVLDRSKQTTMPDNTVTSSAYGFGYDRVGVTQFETRVIDANGKQKLSYRDVRGLITTIKEFNGDATIMTSYFYDALKQIVRVIDDKMNHTTVAYDNLGRRTRIDNPDAGLTESVYDLAGNMTQKITANLRTQDKAIEYDYDFSRLMRIRYPIFTANNVSYTYGAPNLAGNANGNRAGRVTMVTDASGIEERFYGPLGETVKEVKTIPPALTLGSGEQIYTTEYTYDTWDRVMQLTYPDGGSDIANREVLTYEYDSGGLVMAAAGKKGNKNYSYLVRLDYDKFGQRLFMELGNGVKTTYAYRADNRRLDNLSSQLPQPSQYVFQNISYTYDAVGNITQLANDVAIPDTLSGNGKKIGHPVGGPSAQTFVYDDLYRLTGATGTYQNTSNKADRYTMSMAYDSVHNITKKNQRHEFVSQGGNVNPFGATTYLYNYHYVSPKPHAASDTGPYTMLYDGNGNLIRRENRDNNQIRQLIWDEENRLACTQENKQIYLDQVPDNCVPSGSGNEGLYIYNAEGLRIFKDNGKRQFAINQHYTEKGPNAYKHVLVGTQRLATKKAESGTKLESLSWFYSVDHLGSASYLTNTNGELQEHLSYFPSGELHTREHPSQPIEYGLTGNQLDSETGYFHFAHRNYDPKTSAWISTDPALDQYLPSDEHLDPAHNLVHLKGRGGVYNSLNLHSFQYAGQNPVKYSDPNGMWIEDAVIGIPSLILGAHSLYNNAKEGNYGAATLDFVGMVADGVAIALPAIPGGAGYTIKAIRAGDKMVDTAKAVKAAKKAEGVIYKVPGAKTPSGKPYIGRSDNLPKRTQTARDGRNRQGAEKIGTYPKGDKAAGRVAEQKAINREGGLDKLDNKRNEIAPSKWKEKGVE